jgi:hypothetical protein
MPFRKERFFIFALIEKFAEIAYSAIDTKKMQIYIVNNIIIRIKKPIVGFFNVRLKADNNLGGSISLQTRMIAVFFDVSKVLPYQHITEHAYFLDYGTDKASYIKRFAENIPWGVIERRAGVVV